MADPIEHKDDAVVHTPPEFAVAGADARAAVAPDAEVAGTSLWKNAWRRLLKNRLAVFGLIMVGLVVTASLVGPPIIRATTGYTYDYIPSDASLIGSFPPMRAPTAPAGTSSPGCCSADGSR
jgi:hypothetical protein